MVTEEHKVTLVVQSDCSSGLQIWYLREQTCEHPADSMTQHRVEVVHDQLWVSLSRRCTMVSNLIPQFDA